MKKDITHKGEDKGEEQSGPMGGWRKGGALAREERIDMGFDFIHRRFQKHLIMRVNQEVSKIRRRK